MKRRNLPYSWPLTPWPPGVRVWPVIVGRADHVNRPRYGGAWPYALPNYVVRGRVRRVGSSGSVDIGPGQLYCNWPGVPYEIIHDRPADPWQSYWMRLEGPDTTDVLRAFGFSATNPVVRVPDSGKVVDAFRQLHRYYGGSERDPYQALALLYHLVSVGRSRSEEKGARGHVSLVGQAQALVESLLDTGLNAGQLARMLGVSRNTLRAAFYGTVGRTPIEYLRQVRLERARRLLRTTNEKLRTIAIACGYTHEKYFLRCFREAEATTPSQWRRLHGER